MNVTLAEFGPQHVLVAAALVAKRYAAMRSVIPALPECYEDPSVFTPRLRKLEQQGAGAAALKGNRLVGFVVGVEIESFRGFPTWLSPEWANGAGEEDRQGLHERLYAAVADLWCGKGAAVGHLVLQFAFDQDALNGWNRLGFGMATVDGVRALSSDADLDPNSTRVSVSAPSGNIAVRRATPADRDVLHELIRDLQTHLASSPIYLPDHSFSNLQEVTDKLDDRSQAVFIACCEGDIVGYLEIGPASNNACTIIRDPGTASITGAFVRPSARGRDFGLRLLGAAVAWAREQGYARCAVDFESMNTSASRFWSRYFDPVCVGVLRILVQ
ncbi:GNAT family N-acetyltransferase [Candidatus Bipolaricaulota bacterium]|nr:GNAT family N-acetyltransferase [Candidatus Bipolaricaulota bacterium]